MKRSILENVLKEVIVLNRIKCSNLIHDITSYFIENKTLFVLMNYFEYERLDHRLNNFNSRKDNDFVLKAAWLTDLAFALDYLHLHLQAHKMICSHNIYIIPDSERLFLGEIGIKEFANNEDVYMKDYLSPEKNYDLNCDIWSLGCVFYEIVYLEKPFKFYNKDKKEEDIKYNNKFNIFNEIINK